jgi:hypothetical protein
MQVRYELLLRHTGAQSVDAVAEFEIVLRCAEGMGAAWGAVLLGSSRSFAKSRRWRDGGNLRPFGKAEKLAEKLRRPIATLLVGG